MWRASLPDGPVIVKQLVAGPEARARYAREVTVLGLAAAADPPVVPSLLGTDPGERVLVLEDLADHPPGDDWVIGYAAALARLHACGAGSGAPAGAAALPGWAGPSAEDLGAFMALAGTLGVQAPRGVRRELEELVERLAGAPGQALLHGDPCPDNALHAPGGTRFIDFEYACRGDGLVELAYLRIGFPTCWCATAPDQDLLAAAEAAYRTAWRTATGCGVQGDLADACAGWLLRADGLVERALRGTADHWSQLLEQDWTWGIATARQRLLHRLFVVSQLAVEGGALAETGRLAGAMAASVLSRWPGLQPLPSRRA